MTQDTLTTPTADPRTDGRRLATVETVTHIDPIPDADAIVRARIRGWDVVVKLGEFTPGDLCLYLEVDTLIDVTDERFAFLAPRGVRTTVDGTRGHVLKTARLRGVYSQGLALPLELFPELDGAAPGDDVTGLLGLTKWDPPIPAELSGAVKGPLPGWISKTDEDRIQNRAGILNSDITDWVATEKVDGASATFYIDPATGEVGAGTRQWDLEYNPTKTLWRLAAELNLHELLAQEYPGVRAAVQGEVHGEGIQSNPLQRKGQHFAAFNLRVAGIDVPRPLWPDWLAAMSVPVRSDLTFPTTVEQALADVDGLKSAINPTRAAEGVVWRSESSNLARCSDGSLVRASVKVVSNRYLLKHDR